MYIIALCAIEPAFDKKDVFNGFPSSGEIFEHNIANESYRRFW
jgi:hypothetical protein